MTLLTENWAPRQGGIEQYLMGLMSELATHDRTVIAPRSPVPVTAETTTLHLERRRFTWPLLKPAWLPLYVTLHRRAKRGEIELLVCGKALFEGLLGYYLKKFVGIPYVVCTYAMEIKTWAATPRTRRKLQRVLSSADAIVYINDITKQHLLHLGAKSSQLVKIPPGVADRFFNTIVPELSRSTAEHYGVTSPYILSVGRLIPRKGFETLIEAYSQLDQTTFGAVQLVIVGSGPELERLRACAEQNYVSSSVTFLTNVPDAHLPALYAGAELFALTPNETATDMEGFGIVYGEAAAQDIPAIATDTGGAKEAVIQGTTGLVVPPSDVRALTQALTKLLTDPTLRQHLGHAAKQHAEQEFRWARAGEKIQTVIANLQSKRHQ